MGNQRWVLIQGAARLRVEDVPSQLICVPEQPENNPLSLISMLVTDISLLFIMLVGLFRLRRRGGGTFPLAQVLWRQGVLLLLIATIAGVPPVVFITLNLNAPFDAMFQMPSWITMIIAGTRMHRSLVEFASRSTQVVCESPDNSNLPVRKTSRSSTNLISLHQLEVTIDIDSEQLETPQEREDDSWVGITEQMRGKPSVLNNNDDVERNV